MDKEFLNDTLLDDELLPDELFTSQVAQIRAKENTLLSSQALENLMACENEEECVLFLLEKGWGPTEHNSPEELIREEKERCWAFIRQLCDDNQMKYFDIFRYNKDYHNLKAAIKESYVQKHVPDVYMEGGTIPVESLKKCAADNDFSILSFTMMRAAQEARDVLFHTGDSQLCDVIIDKAALSEIYRVGKDSGNTLIREYAELKCGSADINIAIRASRAGKGADFLQRAFVECDSISVPRLISAACNGMDSIYEYLSQTSYADAVEAIRKGAYCFDKWCDDRMMALIKPQKYNAFSVSPLAAYVLAKENEIKSVRMILSGRINDLPEDKVRERLRETYV